MTYLGDFVAGQTVRAWWNTNAIAGESITRATNGTVSIYKDGSTTQSTAGVTDTEDFDGLTGVHQVAIDTSADGTFYAAGSEFAVVLSAATIDGKTINAVLAQFSIENRNTKADVTKWLGTAVATPAVAGRPSVAVVAFDATAQAGIIDAIWDESLAGHAVEGTAGDTLADIEANVLDIAQNGVTVGVNLDKTNYALSVTSRAAVADDMLDELLSGHAIAGSVGAALTAAAGASGITVDDIFEADPADYDADAASFAARFLQTLAQSLMIGASELRISAPVAKNGNIAQIVRGDTYTSSRGRALTWRSADWLAYDLLDPLCTITLRMRRNDALDAVVDDVDVTPSLVMSDTQVALTAELTAAQTAKLTPSIRGYRFEIEASTDDGLGSPTADSPVTLVNGFIEEVLDSLT